MYTGLWKVLTGRKRLPMWLLLLLLVVAVAVAIAVVIAVVVGGDFREMFAMIH